MNSENPNAQQATYWDEVGGPHWVRQQRQFDRMLASFGQAALEALAAEPGERVLDVGCGTGFSSLRLAEAVGPTGVVVGCDIAPSMITGARARGAGVEQLSFEVLDAQQDDLAPDAPFDAVHSRFGVMFFSEPDVAFTNIGAATRPGGRLAFACWQHESKNEWIALPAQIMRRFTPDPVFAPENAPGPFAFHDPDRIRAILTTGGWTDIEIQPCTAPTMMGGGDGLDAALEQTMGTSVAQIMRKQVDDDTFAAATAAVRDALAARLVNEAVVFDGNVWIVTARRPT
ncbi:MAG: class I SAM-dependent methyltransferase [Ilumatobacteraceae bacterium]